MAIKYVDSFKLTNRQFEKFKYRLDGITHFKRPIDIWVDEITKLDSSTLEEYFAFITIKGEYGSESKKFFVRSWEINPTHTNPLSRFYIDDLYSFDTFKPVLRKDRTNILKFVHRYL